MGAENWLHAEQLGSEKDIQKENISSSCIHVGSIDQGAMCLGGFSSVHANDGSSPFYQALYVNELF